LASKLCFNASRNGDTGLKAAELILIILSDDGLPAPNAAALAMALEPAAAAVARLAMALAGHPLAAAWAYRARLDAVRRQAAADGMMIDPWHLAALVEGVRLRLDPAARLSDRGAIFAAARHALALCQWSSRPDNAQQAAISAATAHLATIADNHEPLLGAACALHAWLDQGGERPPLRAALARYWVERGVTAIDLLAAAPLLSATALAQLLGIAIKNTLRLLDGLVVQGLVSEAAMLAHDPFDPLARDGLALGAPFGTDARRAVSLPVLRMNPPDIDQQLAIGDRARALRP
jgi:hypothetical protein